MRSTTLMKLLTLGIATAGLALAVPAFSEDAKPAAKMQAVDTEPLTAQELASALGVHVWKFDLANPPEGNEFTATLMHRDGDKETVLDRFWMSPLKMATPETKLRILVMIVPLGTEGEKARVRITVSGQSTSKVIDNPLAGSRSVSRTIPLEMLDDHTIKLCSIDGEGGPRPPLDKNAGAMLTLKIEAK